MMLCRLGREERGKEWKITAFLLSPFHGKVHRGKGHLWKEANVSFFYFSPHACLSAESFSAVAFAFSFAFDLSMLARVLFANTSNVDRCSDLE